MLAKTPRGIPPDLAEYAREIERIVNAQWREPIHAEITSETAVAQWLLVRTVVNEDGRARRHLARRRFGVFRPVGVFPAGYLFVFVFDAGKMLDRIKASPGVKDVICAVPDTFVQDLRADYAYSEPAPRRSHVSVTTERHSPKKPKAKKLGKPQRKTLNRLRKLLKRLGFKDQSTLESARGLEVHERIALLQKTANALTRASLDA